jgi:biotin transport system substrate-specific component
MSSSALLSAKRFSLSSALWSLGLIGGFALLTALASHVRFYLPFTPVPITLQTMVVVMAGAFLGANRGFLSMAALILAGSLGVAVFTTSTSVLLGATGGYIFGFALAAYVAGAAAEKGAFTSFAMTYIWLLTISLFILVPGMIWLKTFLNLTWTQAFQMGFAPFVLGDLVKTAGATAAVWGFQKWRKA